MFSIRHCVRWLVLKIAILTSVSTESRLNELSSASGYLRLTRLRVETNFILKKLD